MNGIETNEEGLNRVARKTFSANAKKKILSIICAMAFSLTLMGVGVVAALSQFDVTIGNAITVEVVNVEGSVYAKRIGGVDPQAEENAEPENFNTEFEFYNNPIYTTEYGVDKEVLADLQTPVNVNAKGTSIQYIFQLTTDTYATSNTKISIDTFIHTYMHEEVGQAEISYKYYYGQTEPTDWSGAQEFDVNMMSLNGHLTNLEQAGTPIYVPADTTVFVLAEFKLVDQPNISIDKYGENPLMWEFEIFFEATNEDADVCFVDYNSNTTDSVSNMPLQYAKTEAQSITISDRIPEREGYGFVGWATSASATVAEYLPGDEYSGAGMTLYAIWSRHTLVFYATGGQFADSSEEKTFTVAHNETLNVLVEMPSKEGYVFVGWYTSETEWNNYTMFSPAVSIVTEDMTLYAAWIVEPEGWGSQ